MNKEQAEKVIKDFVKEIATQDTACTATAVYYSIRTDKEVITADGCGDYYRFVWEEDRQLTLDAKTREEALKELPEFYQEYSDRDITSCSRDELCELLSDDFEVFEAAIEEDYRGVFLTKSDAERHLKSNHYHYSENANVFCHHVWRAPKLEAFLNALKHLYL